MTEIKAYLDQDFEFLKSGALESGNLFEDEKFPPNQSSLYRFKNFTNEKIGWKRAKDIVENPQFIVNKIEPNDIDQGIIGNCWLLSATACVISVPHLIERVVPSNQSFDHSDYAGIFHFRFYVNGEWVDVVVDDYLPVYGDSNTLCFCKNSVESNEMFGPLLEKAYAKLNICYEFLVIGLPQDAFVDLTGGMNELYSLSTYRKSSDKNPQSPNHLWEIIFKAKHYNSLYTCTKSTNNNEMHSESSNGLINGHVYSIMNFYEVIEINGVYSKLRRSAMNKPPKSSIKLLKIRNPWGLKDSYSGPWSKQSDEWNKIGDGVKKVLNPDKQDDGQFYMSFEDFIYQMDYMNICHVNVNSLSNEELEGEVNWRSKMFKGEWTVDKNAGGCRSGKLFWTNPQHKVSIGEKTSAVISLSQEGISRRRFNTKGQFNGIHESIGFYVYSIKTDAQPNQNGIYEMDQLTLFKQTSVFRSQKDNSLRVEIPHGDYIIIPCCFQENKSGSYVLRIFLELQPGEEVDKTYLDEEYDDEVYDEEDYDDEEYNDEEYDEEGYEDEEYLEYEEETDPNAKLYFIGVDKEQLEELKRQHGDNVSQACQIM